MKERPILFSSPMVRALLAGTKTQTRRALKLPHGFWETSDSGQLVPIPVNCPYGQPGDQLWVRETTHKRPMLNILTGEQLAPIYDGGAYSADNEDVLTRNGFDLAWWYSRKSCPSIHMPRWVSRISLEITGVHVERLQAIAEADIHAEGAISEEWLDWREDAGNVGLPPDSRIENERDVFRNLWESINGPDSWDSNPWVWVIKFKRVEA